MISPLKYLWQKMKHVKKPILFVQKYPKNTQIGKRKFSPLNLKIIHPFWLWVRQTLSSLSSGILGTNRGNERMLSYARQNVYTKNPLFPNYWLCTLGQNHKIYVCKCDNILFDKLLYLSLFTFTFWIRYSHILFS